MMSPFFGRDQEKNPVFEDYGNYQKAVKLLNIVATREF
jgi:hypothetical protein